MAGVRGVDAITVRLERLARRVERSRRPPQVARHERDLGLGEHAAGTRHRFSGAEAARRAAQQQLGPGQIAELRHGDAAQRQGRRIVAERDARQRAERIAGGEGPPRGGDQRVHANPATLVTPTVSRLALNLPHGADRHGVDGHERGDTR